jgi:hypothetical protein
MALAELEITEQPTETVIFDPNRIEVHTNEYAVELAQEINDKVPGFRARIEPTEPRVVIRERLI